MKYKMVDILNPFSEIFIDYKRISKKDEVEKGDLYCQLNYVEMEEWLEHSLRGQPSTDGPAHLNKEQVL